MLTRIRRFNIYLLTGLCLLTVLTGCETTPEEQAENEKKKYRCVVRLHLESPTLRDGFSIQAPIYRQAPLLATILKDPSLHERDVASARVVEALGGFAIRIEFNDHGKLVLDTITTANRGRRLAVHAMWQESRWLGAPIIAQRISDGVFTFTPDATREEADRIVRGINNVVKSFAREERLLLF